MATHTQDPIASGIYKTGHMAELVKTASTNVLLNPFMKMRIAKAITISRHTPKREKVPSKSVAKPITAATTQNKDCAKRECNSSAIDPESDPVCSVIEFQLPKSSIELMFLIEVVAELSMLTSEEMLYEKSLNFAVESRCLFVVRRWASPSTIIKFVPAPLRTK